MDKPHGEEGVYVSAAKDTSLVCKLYERNRLGWPNDSAEANARLIAAAPDLLASAKRLHAGVGNMLIQYPHLAEFMDDVLVSGLQDTLAAIAKAEKSENSA